MDKKTKITSTIGKVGITGDYKKIQQIIGIIAAGGIIFTGIDVISSHIDPARSIIIWSVLAILAIFTSVFFLIPAIYMKKGLAFLPDLIFNVGFFILMVNLGVKGGIIITLLMLLMAVNAFTRPTWLFIMSVFETLTAILLYYLITPEIAQSMPPNSILFQLLGLVTLIIVLRTFAKETISLRSEQKHLVDSAQQLESQRDEILALINSLSDGLILVDKNQKITIANNMAISMLAKDSSSSALSGKLLSDVMSVSSDEASVQLVSEVLESGKQTSYKDLKLVTPVGMFRIFVNTNPIIDKNGHQLGATISFRDITAEKSLEEQRTEFNAVASHELRTPLAVMDGYMYSLLLDKSLKYDAKTKDYIEQVDKAVKSLIRLTNDILTVTKSDNNQIKSIFEKTDIKKIIKEVGSTLKEKATAKKLKLVLNVANDLPVVLTDGEKFKEVMINLTENAIKFTEKGSVTVNAHENEKGIVLVEVIDTGEGIGEADQKRIFNRFFRVNDFRTQKAGGTGLGLFIARTFVTALGGKIGVKSEKDKGSTFWFSIPVTVKKKIKLKKSEKQLGDFVQSI